MVASPDSSSEQCIVGFGYLFELLWQNQIPQQLFFLDFSGNVALTEETFFSTALIIVSFTTVLNCKTLSIHMLAIQNVNYAPKIRH